VNAFGLTPGSSHVVELQSPQGATITQFSPLTANGAGQAQATLDSTDTASVPDGSRLVILLDGQNGAIASEPVAQTPPIAAGQMSYQLQPVEVGPTGTSYGTPHIHLGSCSTQGPVQYMLMDFTANSQGQITHEVRTVTGVTTPVPATGWYLNLHQGDMNNILANGQPTLNFRPLLCANL